jgi:AraC-like DNA-binding protein
MPSLEVAIVLNFASPHRTLDALDPKRTTDHREAWVVGLQHRHQVRIASGSREYMVIRFTPLGAYLFLRTPMELLVDRTIDLEEIDRPFAEAFIGRIKDTPGWAARFDLVERTIAERLGSVSSPPVALIHSWQRLLERPNNLDLALLPSESACSRRHLIAQFCRYFGMPPKTIARVRRFNLVLGAINRLGRNIAQYPEGKPYLDLQRNRNCASGINPPIRWADLALDRGYYDQPHFIKEFRAFAGLTPVEFLRQTWLDGDGPSA